MGWADTWDDIVQGGSERWKVNDETSHQAVLAILKRYMKEDAPQNILCPLCGDDPMVYLLWQQGHSVTAMDLVPVALERMRQQFEGSWTQEEITTTSGDAKLVCFKHESGRATQYQGDALQFLPSLQQTFDVVYDKDSFGALPINLRSEFCARMAEYTKSTTGMIYIEVKLRDNHDQTKHAGPPFSLQKEDLMDPQCYGAAFEHVQALGSVYPTTMGGMQQTGHILKRKTQ